MDYIDYIENNNYFEILSLSNDDLSRNKFYSENVQRNKQKSSFDNYNDYLISLNMKAEIKPFCNIYIDRITQLINKTNQFNLTTKRYKLNEIESISKDDTYISLYGKLEDKFGDNGLISVLIGEIVDKTCIIDTWLMSCRVIKRNMEFAIFDMLIRECNHRKITKIIGVYKRTKKNNMVSTLFSDLGFSLVKEEVDKSIVWEFKIINSKRKQTLIKVN